MGGTRIGAPAKLAALLCWYDEQPAMLAELVASVARCCDHIVAVDGAYRLYPNAKPRSAPDQAEAIQRTANGAGIGCTLHVPGEPWEGNEVEKRTKLFQLGCHTGADWFLSIDGDEVITDVSWGLRERLGNTGADAVIAKVIQDDQWDSPIRQRRLFRRHDFMWVEGAHFVYCAENEGHRKKYLWGREDIHNLEPAADFSPLLVIHNRHLSRHVDRTLAMRDYNLIRDAAGVERLVQTEVSQ